MRFQNRAAHLMFAKVARSRNKSVGSSLGARSLLVIYSLKGGINLKKLRFMYKELIFGTLQCIFFALVCYFIILIFH